MESENSRIDEQDVSVTLEPQFDYSQETNLLEEFGEYTNINTAEIINKAKEIGHEIKSKFNDILNRVKLRLKQFVPEFDFNTKINIKLGFFRRADFRTDGVADIYVDLLRLTKDPNYLDTFEKGITHEIFHVWFTNDYDWLAENPEKVDIEAFRKHILFRIIDEGFAVFISGQSLKDFYKNKGLKHEEILKKGREFLSQILKTENKDVLVQIKKQGFDSMGPLYALGFELVKEFYEKTSKELFRRKLAEIKNTKNDDSFFED